MIVLTIIVVYVYGKGTCQGNKQQQKISTALFVLPKMILEVDVEYDTSTGTTLLHNLPASVVSRYHAGIKCNALN